LVAQENLAVLWTTHLIDEIVPQDQVIVLHQGRVLADGTAAEIVAAQGADSIGGAFEKLTSKDDKALSSAGRRA
jgi:ABC-2 type transport system ATP-binding protein